MAWLLLLRLLCIHAVYAKLHTFVLDIAPGLVSPDCYNQSFPALLVNGQYPAPAIRVTKNDHVHLIVRNRFNSQPTTIHVHGIFQIGSIDADGVPGVTQAAIRPGEEYHHHFQVLHQAGTFYYHAHVGLQDDSVSGPFIVYESEDAWPDRHRGKQRKLKDGPYIYDDERIIYLQEWWHQTPEQRMHYVMGKHYNGMTGADSYLINGGTVYGSGSPDCPGYTVVDVEPGKVYRLHVIGAVTLATLGLRIAEHNITIIEVDGVLVEPYQVSNLEVSPGQRFSVLLTTKDQSPGSRYLIDTKPYYIAEETSNGKAILQYTSSDDHYWRHNNHYHHDALSPPRSSSRSPSTIGSKEPFPPEQSQWIFNKLKPLHIPSPDYATRQADRTIILYPVERQLADNTTRWSINDRFLRDWMDSKDLALLSEIRKMTTTTLNQSVIEANRQGSGDGYDAVLGTFPAEYNQTLDFVIHTSTITNGICIGHPWHTHGHVHYVLANGAGEYNHERDKDLRTYPTPIARDTTFVYPVQPGPPSKTPGGEICGWSKIRLFTVNAQRQASKQVPYSYRPFVFRIILESGPFIAISLVTCCKACFWFCNQQQICCAELSSLN